MTSMNEKRLNKAIEVIRAGDKKLGWQLLSEILQEDPSNETALMWLSVCTNDVKLKKGILKKVLSINPNNQNAQKALAVLVIPPPQSMEVNNPHIRNTQSDTPDGIKKSIPARPQLAPVLSPIEELRETSNGKPKVSIPESSTSRREKWIFLGLVIGIVLTTVVIAGELIRMLLPSSPNVTSTAISSSVATAIVASLPTVIATSDEIPSPTVINGTCQSLTQVYIDSTSVLKDEFITALIRSDSTNLAPAIQEMKRIRDEFIKILPPGCAQNATNLIVSGMNCYINAYIDYETNGLTSEPANRNMSQGIIDWEDGFNQLTALASGQVTPTAQPSAALESPAFTQAIITQAAQSTKISQPTAVLLPTEVPQPPPVVCPSDYEKQVHEYNLQMIDYIYLPLLDALKSDLRDAMLYGDALIWNSIKQQLDYEQASYDSEILEENTRFNNLCR